MRKLLRYRGLLVIVLWQAAPVQTVRDPGGRLRLAVGYATGAYEYTSYSCEGELLEAEQVGYTAIGGGVEAWPTDRLHVSAFAGAMSADRIPGENASEGQWDGGFAGGQLAYEGGKVGIGAGIWKLGSDGFPSGMLRVGRLDGTHVRFEVAQPTPTFASNGLVRVGIGHNLGRQPGVSGSAGWVFCHFCDSGQSTGAYGELAVPVGRTIDITGGAVLASGERHRTWNATIGARANLGRR